MIRLLFLKLRKSLISSDVHIQWVGVPYGGALGAMVYTHNCVVN